MGFEICLSVGMVMVSPVKYPLEDSIGMLIWLLLRNSFSTYEVSLVGISLEVRNSFIIGTWEGSLVGWSLVLTLGSSLESPNHRDVFGSLFEYLTVMMLGMYLGHTLGYFLKSIWYINLCGSCLGIWQFLWRFNWFASLLFSLIGTWHTDCHTYGIFNW